MACHAYKVLRGVVHHSGFRAWPGEVLELEEAEGDALCVGPGAVLERVTPAPAAAEAPPQPVKRARQPKTAP